MSSIHIKDLDKKSNIDGTESILIQDSNGTKQLDINTLLNNNNNVDIYKSYVSVLDFGVKEGFGVNVTTNTTCFQNAINYVAENSDKVLVFPSGNFVFNPVNLGTRHNITIVGSSSSFASFSNKNISDPLDFLDRYTRIFCEGSMNQTFFTHKSCVLILKNIAFYNTTKKSDGTYSNNEAKKLVLMQHVRSADAGKNVEKGKAFCTDCGFYGFKVVFGSDYTFQHLETEWGSGLTDSTYEYYKQSCVVASRCRFTRNGIGINQSVDARIIDCSFNKNDYAIVFRENSGFSTVSNCRIEWNNYNGIYAEKAHDITISNCEFDCNGWAGLVAKNNTNSNFTNSVFRRNGAKIANDDNDSHKLDYTNNVHFYFDRNDNCNIIGLNTLKKASSDVGSEPERPSNCSNFTNNVKCIISLNSLNGCTKVDKIDANKMENNVSCIITNNNNKIDLSDYATKTHTHTTSDITDLSIPTKTSNLTNDSGFLTSIPDEYITETELTAKGYATTSYVNNAISNISSGGSGGSSESNTLSFSSISDFNAYTVLTTDIGKIVTINDGIYELSNTLYDWSLSTSTDGIYLNIKNLNYINYSMFGCHLDGVNDDYDGMVKAHAYSNTNKVLLKNNTGIIYKANNTALKVKYDMDLSGSTILINNNNYQSTYQIVNDTETMYGYTNKIDKTYLRQGTSQFPMTDNSLPANCVIHMSDGNPWATRNDAGKTYTENRYELMFHHAFGICSGDLIADWSGDDTNLTFNYSKYNERTLTIKGCRIRIETSTWGYMCVINCLRHNTVIKDMFIDTKPSSITSGTTVFKNAPIQIKDCYNIRVENITGTNIAGDETTRRGSGYTLRLINVYKCVFDNININGFWGATGMNCVKDITFQNCTLNRIDVHMYCSDINIKDSTLYDWGICVGYGTGTLTANNVKFVNLQRPNMGNRFLIDFNNTYGNLFTGDVTLRDCELITDGNDMSIVKIDFITGNTPTRAEVKMPNINIDNLKAVNISSTDATLYMFNLAGESDFSSSTIKIKQAKHYIFKDISFYNLSDVKQNIKMFWDSTAQDMYSTDINPKVIIDNVDFSNTINKTGLLANAEIVGVTYTKDVKNMNIIILTQSEYNAITTKDSNTIYIIKE